MNLPQTYTAWAAPRAKSQLEPLTLKLSRQLNPNEVLVKVTHCGICHSDVHLIDNDWGVSEYPLVPGHEIIGEVMETGLGVQHLHPGEKVGIGWQSSSCLTCHNCITGRENLCRHSGATCVGHQGGYAEYHVTDSRFAFKIPSSMNPAAAAPLLCGGATVFSPLREFLPQSHLYDCRVGVVGLGGLGHLGIKFANAMGYEVAAFTSNLNKSAELKVLGAHHVHNSTDPADILKLRGKLDMVLVTGPFDLNWEAFLQTLRPDGTLCFVGVPPSPLNVHVRALLGSRLRIAASPIAGRARIEEMLEFAARKNISAQVEVFPATDVNKAIEAVRAGKVRFRAVLEFNQ